MDKFKKALRDKLMLEYIRSGTLDKFKKALHDALSGGQGFAVAARDCTTKFMRLFDEQCKDAVIKQAKWDLGKVRDKLACNLDSHIAEVRTVKLSELNALYESKLKEALIHIPETHQDLPLDPSSSYVVDQIIQGPITRSRAKQLVQTSLAPFTKGSEMEVGPTEMRSNRIDCGPTAMKAVQPQ